jgi:ABC-type phosphate transport system substrate-binding protein
LSVRIEEDEEIVKNVRVALAGLVLAVALAFGASADEGTASFKVVVNPSVTGLKLPKDTLAQIYLGNAQRWGDGKLIVPVDRSLTSSVREAFAGSVLGMPIEGVKSYWLRSIGNGKRPPTIKATDDDVLAFVASEPGAIGYVSEAANVPATVRVISLQ